MPKARRVRGRHGKQQLHPLADRQGVCGDTERLKKMLLIRRPEEREVDQRTGAASALPKAGAAFVP